MNATHLNLTKLSTFADDELFVKLWHAPSFGWLERVDEALGIDSDEMDGTTMFGGGEEEDEEEEGGGREKTKGKVENGRRGTHYSRECLFLFLPNSENGLLLNEY